jgi:hypothetical protein
MQIRTTGGTRTSQKLIKDITRFCAENLMKKRLADTLHIRVELVDKLDENNEFDGDCCYEDEDNRPKEFIIRVNGNMRLNKQLRTICHEMVHVKQYAAGEMRYMWRPARHTKYKGELYPDSLNYWECPWEIEAFGREVGLYSRWVDAKGWTGNEIFDSRNVPDEIPQEEKELLGMK